MAKPKLTPAQRLQIGRAAGRVLNEARAFERGGDFALAKIYRKRARAMVKDF